VNPHSDEAAPLVKSHLRPSRTLETPELKEKLNYVFTDEDAVLLKLVERIERFAGKPGRPLDLNVDLSTPAFEPYVKELKERYGVDAALHFEEKGLKTYGDFAKVAFEAGKEIRYSSDAQNMLEIGSTKPEPWFEALKQIIYADPEQPTLFNADFQPTRKGGYEVSALDILNA
jgi:hypothetical protein